MLLSFGHTGDWVDSPRGVHLVLRLIDRWGEAVALLRDRMHDDGAVIVAGVAQCPDHGVDIVSVNRTNVFDAQFWEHLGGQDGGLHSFLDRMQSVKGALTYPAHGLQALLTQRHELVIAMLRADAPKVF